MFCDRIHRIMAGNMCLPQPDQTHELYVELWGIRVYMASRTGMYPYLIELV